MPPLELIAVHRREADPHPTGHAAGLAAGAEALLATGLSAELGADTAVISPELPDAALTGDPVVDLGHFNRAIGEAVAAALAGGRMPVLTGGTCNHLIGMLAGLQQAFGVTSRIGLLWLDAHGDFNTPRTSRSQMLGGMPVATAAGLCHAAWREGAGMLAPLPTNRIVMVDVRNLDPEEAALIAATDVTVARFGSRWDPAPLAAAIASLAGRVNHLYLHIDADILDATLQPNHPTVEPNGPPLEAVMAVIRAAHATGLVRAAAVVSIDPTGPDGPISLASGRALLLAAARGI